MNNIEKLSDSFCFWAEQSLEKLAAAKKKKVVEQRSRGKCVFPSNSSRLKDHSKDRYPINDIDQARVALRYAGKQKSAPWFNGTVEEMRKAVQNAVHRAYPSLKSEKKSTKKKSDLELGLQKTAILKEDLDRHIDELMQKVLETRQVAHNIIGKLDAIKSGYVANFNPELEHVIVKNITKMSEISNNSYKYLRALHEGTNLLLRLVQESKSGSEQAAE